MGRLNRVWSGIMLGAFVLSSAARAEDRGLTAYAAATLGVPDGPSPETGAPLGPFLVYPALMLGAVYNDNLYPAATTRQSGVGLRMAPSVTAIDDEGLHKTSLYFNADAEVYPGAGPEVPSALRSAVSLSAGAAHSWTPTPELALDASIAFTRQNSLLESPSVVSTTLLPAPSLINLTTAAAFVDHGSIDVSVQRSFGAGFFVRAGGRVEDVVYEAAPAAAGTGGGQIYGGSLRIGYPLTPALTGFVEGNADFARRPNPGFDTDVESLAAGLSSDLVSLFRGEIHAGYQRQQSPDGAFPSIDAPTYGATIFYYPTVYLTLSAGLDRGFAFSAAAPISASGGAAANPDLWQAHLQADYSFAAYWRASGSLSWAQTSSATARQTAWIARAEFDYDFWRNLDLTLAYQFARLGPSGGVSGYDQSVGSLGLTYRY